jgi:DNA-binding MarR family transcriptional regulator
MAKRRRRGEPTSGKSGTSDEEKARIFFAVDIDWKIYILPRYKSSVFSPVPGRIEFYPMPRPSTAPRASLSAANYRALASYRHALRRFLHFSTEAARAEGLSQQQYQVLLALKAAPGRALLTIGELAEIMQVRHHSAVGLADRLARRGLLRRVADEVDGRRVRVRLSAAGEKVLSRLAASHRDELRRLGPQLIRSLQSLGVG